MAHLKQKQISDNSCKAIIIDTLLEAVRPLTQEELSREITSLFHILVSAERLKQQIHALSLEGAILLDEDDYLRISPSKQPGSKKLLSGKKLPLYGSTISAPSRNFLQN